MKKAIAILLASVLLVLALPVSIYGPTVNSFSLSLAQAKKSERQKGKDKNTKRRLKKLNSLGIPKSFYRHSYGEDMSLTELGQIVADWIVSEYRRTGTLPGFLTANQPDWLNVKINGQCVSSNETCNRWNED